MCYPDANYLCAGNGAGNKGGAHLEPEFLFQITPPDPERLPQLSLALEKREELFSRQKMPKLWALTDRLNSVKKVPEEVRKSAGGGRPG